MLTKMMKLISIAVLLLTAVLWSYAPSFGLAARFVVALSALLVATQSLTALKTQPLLSIPSITDGAPGSESL